MKVHIITREDYGANGYPEVSIHSVYKKEEIALQALALCRSREPNTGFYLDEFEVENK